jgi:hypothetical protein
MGDAPKVNHMLYSYNATRLLRKVVDLVCGRFLQECHEQTILGQGVSIAGEYRACTVVNVTNDRVPYMRVSATHTVSRPE